MTQETTPVSGTPAPPGASAPAAPRANGRQSPGEHGRRPEFIRSAIESYGSTIAGAVLSLLNVLAVSRALGPAGRGNIAFLTTMAGLTAWAAMLGIPRAVANFAPGNLRRAASFAGTSLALSLLAGLAAIGVVAALILFFPAAGGHVSAGMRWFALASVPMLVYQSCLQQLVRAYYGHRVANVSWVIGPVANVAVNGALALAGKLTVWSALITWVAGQLIITLILAWHVERKLWGFGRPDAALARRMLGLGIKAHFAQILHAGNFRADQWMVGALSTSRELGLYSVAVAWSEASFFLPTALEQVMRPDLVRESPTGARRRAAVIFRASFLATLVTTGALILLAPFLCTVIFGSAFSGSAVQLQVLALGGAGITALKLLGDALTSQNKPMLETASIAVSFVVVLALDVLLIPAHGGLGAAIASAIGYSAGGVAVALIFSRTFGGHLGELAPRLSEVRTVARQIARRGRRSVAR